MDIDIVIVVHAFVTAKLDSCNSLLYGLPKHLLSRLQSIQNTAARVLTHTRKLDHITPVQKTAPLVACLLPYNF